MSNNPFGDNLSDNDAPGFSPIQMEPAVIREAPAPRKVEAVVTGPRLRIVLEENDNIPPTGLFFGADGVGYLLKAGLAAEVPPSIISILDTAIMAKPIVDPITMQITGFRDNLRFPYRVLAHIPAPEKVAA